MRPSDLSFCPGKVGRNEGQKHMLDNAMLTNLICIIYVDRKQRNKHSGKFDIIIAENQGRNQTFLKQVVPV